MAAASRNEFQLIVPQNVEVKLGSDVTVPCHLSTEISDVDMEIRWFKETDCVCLYKNRQVIEGRSYKGRVNLFIHELQRGNVSLLLRDFRESDMGDYLCQVTSQDTTVEVTVRVNESKIDSDVKPVNQPLTFQSQHLTIHEEEKKTWSESERTEMEESAFMTEFVVNMEELHRKLFKAFKDQNKKLERKECDKNRELELDNLRQLLEKEISLKNKALEDMQDQLKAKNTELDKLRQMLENERSLKNKDLEYMQDQLKAKNTELDKLRQMLENERSLNRGKETSKHQLDTLRNTEPMKTLGGVKLFSVLAGKTNNSHERFIATLLNRIKDLREVPTVDDSDIILVFCPVVSRHDIDIEAALKRFPISTASKLNVLVVLHHTFDPEKTVPDSSRCVNRTDILTVDCLFYEDTGLLKSQRNDDAMDKAVNWIIQQIKEKDVNTCPSQSLPQENDTQINNLNKENKEHQSELDMNDRCSKEKNSKAPSEKERQAQSLCIQLESLKLYSILAGKTNNSPERFISTLRKQIPNLKEVYTVDESDIIVVFCPIVSRAGTDIEAALKSFTGFAASKLVALVVLHHTFDPEKTVSDSSRCVNRPDILTVDCLHYEDRGLLDCQKNNDAVDKVVNWLIQQKRITRDNICQRKNKSSAGSSSFTSRFSRPNWPQRMKPGSSSNNTQLMSCSTVKYFTTFTGNRKKYHTDFLDALHRVNRDLLQVSKVQESDVILSFHSAESQAALKDYKRTDKPVVLIVLHNTLDLTSIPNSSGYFNSPDVFIVHCVICDIVEDLPECPINREAITAVSQWLSTKIKLFH